MHPNTADTSTTRYNTKVLDQQSSSGYITHRPVKHPILRAAAWINRRLVDWLMPCKDEQERTYWHRWTR